MRLLKPARWRVRLWWMHLFDGYSTAMILEFLVRNGGEWSFGFVKYEEWLKGLVRHCRWQL